MAIRIRTATPDDAPALMSLGDEFLATTPYGDLPGLAGLMGSIVRRALEQGNGVFVAELYESPVTPEADEGINREVVGMIAGIQIPLGDGVSYVDEVAWFVTAPHRNGRAGLRLLDALEGWACTRGAAMLKISAPAGSNVGEFLERRGYTAAETAYSRTLPTRPASLRG